MSDFSQPPVLHRSDEDTTHALLEDINGNLEEINKGTKKTRTKRKASDPLNGLKSQIENLEKRVKQGVDVSRMSMKDRSNFLKIQNESAKKQKNDITDLIKETRETLLKKKNLSIADKNTLKELKAIKKETEQSGITERNLLKDLFEKLPDNIQEGLKNIGGGIASAVMGPLNLVIQPLQEVFGVNFGEMFAGAFEGIKDKFFNKTKIKPKRNQILKTNPEVVWKDDQDEKRFKKEKAENKKSGFLEGLMGGGIGAMAKNLFPALMKALPFAAIAGGLIWAVVDAIAGIGKAEEWGTSKVAAGLGGFFAGTKSGFIGAFSNMGKWALIGAGIGSVVPVVGTIAGGLIGAAIGGVIGFIGGEKVAKGFQNVGDNVMKAFNGDLVDKIMGIPLALINGLFDGIGGFISTIPQMLVQAITGDAEKALKAKNITKNIVDVLLNSPLNPVALVKGFLSTGINIKNIMKDPALTKGTKFKKIIGELISMPFKSLLELGIVKKAISSMGDFVSPIISSMINFVTSTITGAKNKVFDISVQIGTFFLNLFDKVGGSIKTFLDTNPAVKFIKDYLITPISEFFQFIGDFFGFFKGKNIVDIIKIFGSGSFGSEFAGFQKSQTMDRAFKSEEYIKYAAEQKNNRGFQNSSAEQKYESFNKTKVNDAIITPSGRIIQPSKDDTIIATKNKVTQQGFGEADMDSTLSKLSTVFENTFSDQAIVNAIQELIKTVKEKPVSAGSGAVAPQINLDAMRSI